jgi:hypothetical protein
MLIKWEDLAPGDIVEFNPKFLLEFREEFGRKPRFTANSGGYIDTDNAQFFVIKSVEHRNSSLRIGLDGHSAISVMKDTGALSKFKAGPPVFRVTALAEE